MKKASLCVKLAQRASSANSWEHKSVKIAMWVAGAQNNSQTVKNYAEYAHQEDTTLKEALDGNPSVENAVLGITPKNMVRLHVWLALWAGSIHIRAEITNLCAKSALQADLAQRWVCHFVRHALTDSMVKCLGPPLKVHVPSAMLGNGAKRQVFLLVFPVMKAASALKPVQRETSANSATLDITVKLLVLLHAQRVRLDMPVALQVLRGPIHAEHAKLVFMNRNQDPDCANHVPRENTVSTLVQWTRVHVKTVVLVHTTIEKGVAMSTKVASSV
jgi:hypothetical protein